MSTTIWPLLLCLLATCAFALNLNKRQANGQSTEQNANCFYNLCNETQNYPSEKLTQIVKSNKNFSEMFGSNVVEPVVSLGNRFGIDQENVCKVRTITVFPKKGQNIEKKWRTIVNIGEQTQGVTFETCVESDASCIDEISLALGYRTSCKQQYIIVRMVILNENDQLMLEKFPVPSGCNCVYTSN